MSPRRMPAAMTATMKPTRARPSRSRSVMLSLHSIVSPGAYYSAPPCRLNGSGAALGRGGACAMVSGAGRVLGDERRREGTRTAAGRLRLQGTRRNSASTIGRRGSLTRGSTVRPTGTRKRHPSSTRVRGRSHEVLKFRPALDRPGPQNPVEEALGQARVIGRPGDLPAALGRPHPGAPADAPRQAEGRARRTLPGSRTAPAGARAS